MAAKAGSRRVRARTPAAMLWLAVADAASRGYVVYAEAPTLDAALWNLTRAFARSVRSLGDDLRASLALSEADIAVRPARWRKDGLAYGIRPAYWHGQITVRVPGFFHPIQFADWTHDRLFHTVRFERRRPVRTSVGALKEG